MDSVVADPVRSNALYVTVGGPFRLMKSPDGGRSWRRVRIQGDRGGSADEVAVDPSDRRRIHVGVGDAVDGDRGLLFGTRDGGTTWSRITATGTKPVLALAIAPRTHVVYVGLRAGVRVLEPGR